MMHVRLRLQQSSVRTLRRLVSVSSPRSCGVTMYSAFARAYVCARVGWFLREYRAQSITISRSVVCAQELGCSCLHPKVTKINEFARASNDVLALSVLIW